MDSARFDGLVRSLSQARSRRQTLHGLAGIAASGAVALSGRAVSAQACKSDGKACKKNGQCCSGNCAGGTGTGSTSKSDGSCQPACQDNGSACTQASECCSNNCFNSVCADFVTSCGSSTCGSDTRGCAGDTCCGPPAFFSCIGSDVSQCCGPPATHCEGGRCVA
jgi:hypothetical protein